MIAFSLASFNTLGAPLLPWTFRKGRHVRTRFRVIGKKLQLLSPDVICLQEVFTYLHLRILRRQLLDYPYAIYKKHVLGPKGGLVIFSKLPLDTPEYETFRNKGSFRNLSLYGHIVRMGILRCRLQGAPLEIVNTHLTGNFDHAWEEANRYGKINREQLHQLAGIVTLSAEKNDHVVVVGDLNMDRKSEYYSFFTNLAKLDDVFQNDHFPTLQKELFQKNKNPQRIDYIFLRSKNNSLSFSKTKHLFKEKMLLKKNKYGYLSDHIGLFAYFQ